MSVAEIITEPTLDELAETVRREHGLVMDALSNAVEHALLAGHALLAARRLAQWGEWGPWLITAGISASPASRYMRLATYEEVVKSAPSVRAASKALLGLPPVTKTTARALPEDISDDIKRLREAGMSHREIAATLDVSHGTVQKKLNPESRKRSDERLNEHKRTQRRAAKALARQERDEMMRTVGVDERDAYLTARKLAGLLDKFGMNTEYAKVVAIEDALAARAKAKLI